MIPEWVFIEILCFNQVGQAYLYLTWNRRVEVSLVSSVVDSEKVHMALGS